MLIVGIIHNPVPMLHHLDVVGRLVTPKAIWAEALAFGRFNHAQKVWGVGFRQNGASWPSRLGVVLQVNYLHIEKKQVTETNNNYNQKSFVSGRTGIPFREFMKRCSQTHQGAAGLKTHPHPETFLYKNPKLLLHNSVFLGTWYVRTLWETGKCAQAAREMQRYNLTLMGMCEVRWTGHG